MAEAECPCSFCVTAREPRRIDEARERADGLLARFLSPEQAKDWKANQAFNVRGSAGNWWRLSPTWGHSHRAVIRDDGVAVSVWPEGIEGEYLMADRALALMLYLEGNEEAVYESGCKDHMPVVYRPDGAFGTQKLEQRAPSAAVTDCDPF